MARDAARALQLFDVILFACISFVRRLAEGDRKQTAALHLLWQLSRFLYMLYALGTAPRARDIQPANSLPALVGRTREQSLFLP